MKNVLAVFLMLSVLACSDGGKDEPASNKAELKGLSVAATGDFNPVKIYINAESGEIFLFSSTDFTASTFPLTLVPEIVLSEGATSVPASGAAITFNDPEDFQKIRVTSEDGSNTMEYVLSIRDRQIPNAGFENWFQEIGMNSVPYPEPGKYKESTVWATANMGTSIYKIYGTSPLDDAGNTRVKIETVTTLALPLVAGALYVGKFDLDGAIANPTDPVAAADLGVPFYGKPTAVQFKYSYKSGDQMIQATLNDPTDLFGGFKTTKLEGKDKFGIKIVLEKRVDDMVTEIAKHEFQSSVEVAELTQTKLNLNYMSNDEPTHMYISFSPSFDGGTFKGAVGSTLIIDDIELLYE